jgi:2-polyprenyl-3-methyl-5-hydroxy-6-metoxy-1,4-benzoquinol methylase
MMFLAKKFIRFALSRYGYKIVPIEQRYRPTRLDTDNSAGLLQAIIPEVQHNATTGAWPTPAFLQSYFTPHRLAMVRLLLDQCEAAGVEIAGRRVLDVGCHAGCLLRLIEARYPGASLLGCDISDVKLAMAKRACPRAELFFCSLSELKNSPSYDVVFLMQVLEHLVEPEVAVRRLVDLITDGGTLVLTVPDGRVDSFSAKDFNPEFQSYGGHINFWSPESWRHFLVRTAPDCEVRTTKLQTGQLFAALTRQNASAAAPIAAISDFAVPGTRRRP